MNHVRIAAARIQIDSASSRKRHAHPAFGAD